MKHLKYLLAAGCLGFLSVSAQSDYAAPAKKSPVVALEFTGQNCRFCPDLGRSLHALQEKYGKENYLLAALHNMKSYSLFAPPHVSLYSEKAEFYSQAMDIPEGLPHVYYNSLGIKPDDTVLDKMFQEPDLLECTGTVIYNEAKEFQIEIQTRLRSDRTDFVKGKQVDILFWALENDIEAIQNDNGKWTYPLHQHILRNSVNGDWGEPYQIGTVYRKNWPVPAEVGVLEHTEVMVFFLDHESRDILDAACFKVTKGEATAIQKVEVPGEQTTAPIYDLSGRRVATPQKGSVYIQNRKTFIAR